MALRFILENFFFQPAQTISYMAEWVVGTGSFGIVFQVWGKWLCCCVLHLASSNGLALMIMSWSLVSRPNAWRLVRLLPLRKSCKTSGTKIVSCNWCDPWIIPMWSLWSIVSSPPQTEMSYFLTWWWSLFQRLYIGYSSITAMWIRGCPLSMWSFIHIRWVGCLSFGSRSLCGHFGIYNLVFWCRYLEGWLTFIQFQEFVIEMWSHKIFWYLLQAFYSCFCSLL